MKDRLIELLATCGKCDKYGGNGCVGCEYEYADDACEKHLTDIMANDLLANGVIVPPCNVGQWVYVPWNWEGQQGVATVKVEEINFYDSQMQYMFFIDMESDDESFNQAFGGWKIGKSIGETVFLTKEDAEKALAERQSNEKL